nr:MAG TPA: hypothetical protein [Caudoviricetes sp.]
MFCFFNFVRRTVHGRPYIFISYIYLYLYIYIYLLY